MKRNNKGFVATSILFGIVALLFMTFAIILGNSYASVKNDKMYGNILKGEITNFLGVRLYPNGGYLEKTTLEIDHNGAYGELPIPTRVGYAFTGWYTSIDNNVQVFSTTKYKDVLANKLYARWYKNLYQLRIDPNGGTFEESTSVQDVNLYFEEEKIISVPNRTGYIFEGWTLTGTGSTLNDNIFKMGYSSASLTAKWSASDVRLTVDPQSGTWNQSTEPQSFNMRYKESKEIPDPVRDGYTFTGWSYDDENVSLSGQTLTIGETDVTLKATWQINNYPYLVKHYLEGTDKNYTLVEADTVEGEAAFGTYLKPPFNTYIGYSPVGDEKEIIISSDISKNLIDYYYNRLTYKLTIDPNGGNYNGQLSIDMEYKQSINLSIPTMTGYTFTNWTVTSGEVQDNVFTMGESNANLIAGWKANQYIVTLDPNGGYVDAPSVSVTYDSIYGSLSTPTRDGYQFLGWSLTKNESDIINENTIVKTASSHTLYAIWQPLLYTVTLDTRGGTASTDEIKVFFNTKYSNLPTPTRAKHSFLGWFTDETTGTQVTVDTTFISTKNHTLYARWLPTDAEYIQYSNTQYTTCTNLACSLNELYQKFK